MVRAPLQLVWWISWSARVLHPESCLLVSQASQQRLQAELQGQVLVQLATVEALMQPVQSCWLVLVQICLQAWSQAQQQSGRHSAAAAVQPQRSALTKVTQVLSWHHDFGVETTESQRLQAAVQLCTSLHYTSLINNKQQQNCTLTDTSGSIFGAWPGAADF